jgi:hypothetical protein
VRQFGLAPSVPALAKVEDTALVASLYRGDRLTWP